MLIAERHARLLTLIQTRGICGLEMLARELHVSQSTVRRDIEQLAARGLVKPTHGGVIWAGEGGQPARPYVFDQSLDVSADAKRRIAREARKLVEPGQTIFIDGGTTSFAFARELAGLPIQIATNSLPIAGLFLNDDKAELVVTGGLLYPRYGVFLGPAAEHAIDAIHATTLFLSAAALHHGILFNQNLLLVESQRRMIRQAQRVVLLLDATKFARQTLSRLCELAQIDVLVTDQPPARDELAFIRQAGCQLIVANVE